MRFLIFLMLIAACTNPPKEPKPKPAEEKVQEAPVPPPKKPPPAKPTVIVVPSPAAPATCPQPAVTDKQQVLQNFDCIIQKIEKTKTK